MNWLTTEEIKRRAKRKEGALDVSIEHWRQISTASPKELRMALTKGQVDTHAGFCGLCRHYTRKKVDCGNCPATNICVERIYGKANRAIREKWYRDGTISCKKAQAAAKKVYLALKALKKKNNQ